MDDPKDLYKALKRLFVALQSDAKILDVFFTMLRMGVNDKMLCTKRNCKAKQHCTKMKVSVKGFFSKYDQISERSSLRDFSARNKSRKYC